MTKENPGPSIAAEIAQKLAEALRDLEGDVLSGHCNYARGKLIGLAIGLEAIATLADGGNEP